MPVHDKHVLVLRGPGPQVWHEAFNGLERTGWTVHDCGSELLLAAQLGQISGRFVLCVGSVESLRPKPGQLLAWLAQRGVRCCVWATRASAWDMIEQVQSFGVPVFTRKEAFDDWVKRLEGSVPAPASNAPDSAHSVSEAELAVLLGDNQVE
ncbi:MAG: hypothetical protein GY809_19690 [Planctomycetes bacterium]|nr:hypothetical protein [Planctomycetota bacterium]